MNLLLGGSPSGKIVWMLFIMLGMVDPLRVFMIEIISKGLRKWNYLRKLFKMVIDNLLLLIVIFYFEGLWDDGDFFNKLHFFPPRIP